MNTQIHEYAILHFYILKASHILSIHCVHTCMLSFLCIQLEMSCGFFGLEAINDLLLSLSIFSFLFSTSHPFSLAPTFCHPLTLSDPFTFLLCCVTEHTILQCILGCASDVFFAFSFVSEKSAHTNICFCCCMILFARTEMTAVHDEFAAHQNRLHQMRFMRNDSMTTHKYANMHQNGNKKCWDLFFS